LKGTVSSYAGGSVFQLVYVSGLEAHIKEIPGHGFFEYPFTPVAEPGEPYFVAVIVFRDNVEKLYPAGPAFYAVAFHVVPPSFLLSEFGGEGLNADLSGSIPQSAQ